MATCVFCILTCKYLYPTQISNLFLLYLHKVKRRFSSHFNTMRGKPLILDLSTNGKAGTFQAYSWSHSPWLPTATPATCPEHSANTGCTPPPPHLCSTSSGDSCSGLAAALDRARVTAITTAAARLELRLELGQWLFGEGKIVGWRQRLQGHIW